MAEINFKCIVLLNQKEYNEYYTSNEVLKNGCPVICVIPESDGQNKKIMMKVGDGITSFRSLPWLSGLSADVFDWALQETKPEYTADEIKFKDGDTFQNKYDSGELKGNTGTSLRFRGEYNSSTEYVNNESFIDIVTAVNNTYLCKVTNTGQSLDSETYWAYISGQGTPGQDGTDGAQGAPGKDGEDGKTPIKGEDYWTTDDKKDIIQEIFKEISTNGLQIGSILLSYSSKDNQIIFEEKGGEESV